VLGQLRLLQFLEGRSVTAAAAGAVHQGATVLVRQVLEVPGRALQQQRQQQQHWGLATPSSSSSSSSRAAQRLVD
jgi:hypothetical protein